MKIMRNLSNLISKISEITAGLIIGVVTAILLLQVILRFAFDSGITWSIEFSLFAIIWSVMLIGNVLVKDDELLSVDLFDDILTDNFKKYRNLLYQFIFIILLIVMTYEGFIQAINGLNMTTPSLGIKWIYPYLSIPIGTSLILFQFFYKILENLTSYKEEL